MNDGTYDIYHVKKSSFSYFYELIKRRASLKEAIENMEEWEKEISKSHKSKRAIKDTEDQFDSSKYYNNDHIYYKELKPPPPTKHLIKKHCRKPRF